VSFSTFDSWSKCAGSRESKEACHYQEMHNLTSNFGEQTSFKLFHLKNVLQNKFPSNIIK